MKVSLPDTPCYCSECDTGPAFRVRFENPGVVQQGGFALCPAHAERLALMLSFWVNESRGEIRSTGRKGRPYVADCDVCGRRTTKPSQDGDPCPSCSSGRMRLRAAALTHQTGDSTR